jgi:DNA-binding transcriptional MerR regulator
MKEQFRIGKLAQELGIKRFVIRFWEKEFGLHSSRSSGGQRFYDQKDFDHFKLIKELLYEKGFTIAGAKKVLNQRIKKTAHILDTTKKNFSEYTPNILDKFSIQLIELKKQLMKLRDLL